MRNIGKLISDLRKERNITQDDLATKLQITKQTISNYERGKRLPSYEALEAIADVLNVPMSFFLTKDEQAEELSRIYANYSYDREAENLSSAALRVARVYDSLPETGKRALDAFCDYVEDRA